MSMGHPIHQIQHFQNFTLKIQGQGHSLRPHSRYSTLLTHIPFVRCRWALAFTAIQLFDLENPRSRSWLKITAWVQHSIDSHPFHSMSISHPIPEIWLFQNLILKIQGQGHGWGQSRKSQSGCNILLTNIPFVSIDPSFSKISNFLNLTLKIQGEGEMTMMLHNYRSRKFHRTLNGINPSSCFRDMASTKSGPTTDSLEKFWAMGKPTWDKWANYYDSAQLQVQTSP